MPAPNLTLASAPGPHREAGRDETLQFGAAGARSGLHGHALHHREQATGDAFDIGFRRQIALGLAALETIDQCLARRRAARDHVLADRLGAFAARDRADDAQAPLGLAIAALVFEDRKSTRLNSSH